MKQASLKLNLKVKKTRKQVFLEQMEQVVPLGCVGRTHRAVLSARQHRASAVFLGDDAAHSFHAAMVHAVRSGPGGGFL